MLPVLTLAIGFGLAVSLLFSELFGLAAGGMVVPGYFALYLDEPASVLLTIGIALAAWALVSLVSNVAIVYGRRRTVLTILVGYLLRLAVDAAPWSVLAASDGSLDMVVIGYIIPGLVAIWIDRQGLVETLATLLIAAVVVRLGLIAAFGAEAAL